MKINGVWKRPKGWRSPAPIQRWQAGTGFHRGSSEAAQTWDAFQIQGFLGEEGRTAEETAETEGPGSLGVGPGNVLLELSGLRVVRSSFRTTALGRILEPTYGLFRRKSWSHIGIRMGFIQLR